MCVLKWYDRIPKIPYIFEGFNYPLMLIEFCVPYKFHKGIKKKTNFCFQYTDTNIVD